VFCVKATKFVAHIRFKFFCTEWKMPQGTIKKLVDRGFGFIDGEKGDLFFHQSAVEGTTFEALSVGQQVEYEEGSGPKGPCAENVKLV
jgi:CspA family cold shock protein